jgi:hypothetical protein
LPRSNLGRTVDRTVVQYDSPFPEVSVDVLPIDLTALVAVFMGTLMFLIPIAGITARFALKPLVESVGKFMQSQGVEEAQQMAERRIALLEQNLDALQDELLRIRDAQDFDTALRSGETRGAIEAGPSDPSTSA